jgi:putative phosphoesterase
VASSLRVGVVSDTHGLLRREAVTALRGADVILHAGDVGDPLVLQELGQLAPVIAVRGNVDTGAWARALPDRRRLDLHGTPVLLLHDRAAVGRDPASEGLEIVVFGHSHQPVSERRNGVLWFNPGSAGPRRFRLPVSLGFLDFDGTGFREHLIRLDERGAANRG